MGNNVKLSERQFGNLALGQAGFEILSAGVSYTGNWTALRLTTTAGLVVNGIDLSDFDDDWTAG